MMEKIIVLSLVAIYFFIFEIAVVAMLTAAVREFLRRRRRSKSKTEQLKNFIRPWYPEIDSLPEEEALELGLAFARLHGIYY
jgi:hypothetical protein